MQKLQDAVGQHHTTGACADVALTAVAEDLGVVAGERWELIGEPGTAVVRGSLLSLHLEHKTVDPRRGVPK